MSLITKEYGNSEKALTKIAGATMLDIKERDRIDIMNENVAFLVYIVFKEELAKFLGREKKPVTIGFEKYSTVNTEQNGEKAGNIVPVHEFLPGFADIMNGKDVTVVTELSEMQNSDELEEIANRTLIRLQEENNCDVLRAEVVIKICAYFQKELAVFMGQNPNVTVELASLEKYAVSGDDTLTPVHEFAERFKLSIKDDDETEDDEDL